MDKELERIIESNKLKNIEILNQDVSLKEFNEQTLQELKKWDYETISFKKLTWFKEHKEVKRVEYIGDLCYELAIFEILLNDNSIIELHYSYS